MVTDRLSVQFSKSRKDICRRLTTEICQYIAVDKRPASANCYLPITIHTAVSIDATIDSAEFSDVIAPYAYMYKSKRWYK